MIDGAENNWPSFESTKHFEVSKFYSMTEHSLSPEVLVMSKRSFDKLSKEDQAAVKAAAKESVAKMRELWDAREKAFRGQGPRRWRSDQHGREAALHRRDEAGLRPLRHRSGAEGARGPHPGREVIHLSDSNRRRLKGRLPPARRDMKSFRHRLFPPCCAPEFLCLVTAGLAGRNDGDRRLDRVRPLCAERDADLGRTDLAFSSCCGSSCSAELWRARLDHMGFDILLFYAQGKWRAALVLVNELLVTIFGAAM